MKLILLILLVLSFNNSFAVDLYINEFMASNDAAIPDPEGEFEDWIEIYNAEPNSVNLNGFYLTDDFAVPTKWAFPDTTIGSGEFIIIWADEDLNQDDLHCDFKLSKGGEEIGFYESDGITLIDSIIFGAIGDDSTFARQTDGSPIWIKTDEITPGSTNDTQTNISEKNSIVKDFSLEQNYPNPFNPTTTISFHLPLNSQGEFLIFNVRGEKVKEFFVNDSNNKIVWNGTNEFGYSVSSGIYFYRLQTSQGAIEKKMLLLR